VAGLQKPISGLPSSSTFATADILPIVKGGNTDFITGGNFRTALFGIAQADPLSIGSLTAVGNSTITGTLSGITTFSAAAVVSSGPVQVTGGSQTAGSMWKSATGGLVVQSVAGSSTDFFLGNPGASPIMTVPTGTTNVVFAGGLSGVTTLVMAGALSGVSSIAMSGTLTMSAALSKIVPGVTSFSHRNNGDGADNLLITDAGVVTARLALAAPSITVSGAAGLIFSTSSKIIPSGASLGIRDPTDTLNQLLFNASGATFGVRLLTTASLVGGAGFNIPSGTAPTSPVDGDMWYDGAAIKFRIGAVTKTFTVT
jgi:hypothetical protein